MRFGFLLLVLFPITEFTILIKVGGLIGVLPTIALILFTASAGLFLLRREGFSTMARAREKMSTGQIPAMEMMEGLVIAVCGALLLAPGFITDAIALMGMMPPVRRALITRLQKSPRFQVYGVGAMGGNDNPMGGFQPQGPGPRHVGDDVIDGEFRRED